MNNPKSLFLFLIFFSSTLFCQNPSEKSKIIVNHAHLDHLYQEIEIDTTKMAIIHIYAEYPSYDWVGDDDEGFTCVDDVARAAVYYARDYKMNGNAESLDKTLKLIEFILYMQSENKFYYNFIFPDYSINKTHKNSVDRPAWWSWRALWALLESYEIIIEHDELKAKRISDQIISTVSAAKNYLKFTDDLFYIEEIELPTWLPYKSASDQAALLVITLSKYSKMFNDKSVIPVIGKLADGISLMQIRDAGFDYDGAILSWQNTWHAWGNSQSYSLLLAYEATQNEKYLETSIYELDNFFNSITPESMLASFTVSKKEGEFKLKDKKVFPQIAYNLRPMIFAASKAHEITGERKYAKLAANLASWFYGNNSANVKMYHEMTGICFDGIISESEANKNSGAESTIEALLSLQILKHYNLTSSFLEKFIDDAK